MRMKIATNHRGKNVIVLLVLAISSFLYTKPSFAIEHQVGGILGKEIGVIYTQQHNKWLLSADAGWLTGVAGARVAVNGGYRILSFMSIADKLDWNWIKTGMGKRLDIQEYLGVGVYGQYLHESSKECSYARKMDFNIPYGLQLWAKMSFIYSSWEWSWQVSLPFIFDDKNKEYEKRRTYWEFIPYIMQLSVQYKLKK
jgi:hypothetical protein